MPLNLQNRFTFQLTLTNFQPYFEPKLPEIVTTKKTNKKESWSFHLPNPISDLNKRVEITADFGQAANFARLVNDEIYIKDLSTAHAG